MQKFGKIVLIYITYTIEVTYPCKVQINNHVHCYKNIICQFQREAVKKKIKRRNPVLYNY